MWEDDDWSAPDRLSRQVEAMCSADTPLIGVAEPYYYDAKHGTAWRYVQGDRPSWLTMLMFDKELWRRTPLCDAAKACDTLFLRRVPEAKRTVVPLDELMVCTIHSRNTSPKSTRSQRWKAIPAETIAQMLGDDFSFYSTDWLG